MSMTRGRMGPNLVFGRTRLVGRLHLVRMMLHTFRAQMSGWPRFQRLVILVTANW